jgi:hypothetical protein
MGGRKATSWYQMLLLALTLSATSMAQGPLTTISDTVYRADGTPAQGTVLISWPSFETAGGETVAAGNLSVVIGPLGAFSAQLVPNVGGNPAGTYYVAVFQLDDGTVRTEYWAVPATSPTTITAMETTPGTGLANLAATQQYVNAAVAPLAVDATVVHLAGTETITGTKQFTVPPSLPAPVGTNDATNKGYVDAAVGSVGSGAYVAIAGGTMTGPLTLPADPTAPNQAADQHYVQTGLSAKADMVNGTVPTGELGAGTASSATCLNGNSTWGSCGSGAPAGISYATTALNWTQTISSSLTGGTQATVTLTPCPVGVDTTSGAGYQVLLSGGGNSEAANVITAPGGCTSGTATGTISFTPFYSYPAGYTIGSASSGIQETLNACSGTSATTYHDGGCNVAIPANGPGPLTTGGNYSVNTYSVYGTIFFHSNNSVLSGRGVTVYCLGRGPCLQVGDLANSNDFSNNTIEGLAFSDPLNLSSIPSFAGVNITNTSITGGVATITTGSPHGFRPGDIVTILFTDNRTYWGDAIVTSTPTSTSFTYAHPKSGGSVASQPSPGVVALAYVAVLDNAMNTHLLDLSSASTGNYGNFNNFFDFWDDENATIDHFNNSASSLNANANWTGSFVFSGGASNLGTSQQFAPVITLENSTITANYSNGVTDYNSNGLYIENTVLQATGPWQVYAANSTGNYQGAYLKNIYSESTPALNPQTPPRSPFFGLGIAGLIAGASSGAASFQVAGNGGPLGAFASGGTGTTPYSYFIVANDTTAGTQTSPMQVLNWLSTGSDSIPVRWPRVANGTDAITYDVIRITAPAGFNTVYPYAGGCPGGPGGICGYVAKGLSQSTACSSTLICTYTDLASSTTAAYTINLGTYTGAVNFWPGSIVSVNKTVATDNDKYNVVGIGLAGNPLQVSAQCPNYGSTSAGGFTTCLTSYTDPSGDTTNQTATILTDGAVKAEGMALTKGRLNFSSAPGAYISAHHIITLLDSQPAITQATWGYRPPASVSDTWIGTDMATGYPNLGQLAFGSPVSITNYIAQTGDGVHANWLERLTSSLKEFNVPTKFDQSVTFAGLPNGCLNVVSGLIASTGSPCGSGGGGGGVSSVFGRTGAVVAGIGDYTVSQVTGAAADALVVHLANTETITGAKTFTSNITVSGNLLLPSANGYVPAVGGMGLDTTAGLPVVNIAGTPQQIALTNSNISGQAGTALALATTPTQCSGSFATGISANGNANCTTADVVQLAETAPPAGIPNWGVFWFDSATHSPRVIENNGQVMQLGLSNLFNSDPGGDPADNLEERNGANAENLRVYSSFTNNTTWQRASLGFDATDGYAVVRSENATSASAPGLGFWIGSSLKWVVDAAGNLKPWAVAGIGDNQFSLGSDTGNAAKSIFAKTSFNSVIYGRDDFEIPNDASTGTTLNELATFNTNSPSQAVLAGTSSTNGVIGVVQGGAGKSGNAVITWRGYVYCIFDSITTAGDAVIASTTTAGACHDTGSKTQPAAQLIGYSDVTNSTSGQTNGMRVDLQPPTDGAGGMTYPGAGIANSTGSAWTTPYSTSGTGSVLALTASPVFTGSPTVPGYAPLSANNTFTGNQIIAGNLTISGVFTQTGSEADEAIYTLNSTVLTTPTAGSSAFGFDTTANGGLFKIFENGAAGYSVTNVLALKAPLASPVFTGTPTVPGYVPTGTTVNGHALSSNISVSASDLTTGMLPHAQLPPLVSGDIPNNAANTTGTASNLSGTPTLPAGTVLPGYPATGALVTGNYVKASGAGAIADSSITAGPYVGEWLTYPTLGSGTPTTGATANKATLWGVSLSFPMVSTKVTYDVITADTSSGTYDLGVYTYAGVLAAHIGNTAATSFTAGAHTVNWTATATLQPGKYYVAITCSATSGCATFGGASSNGVTFVSNTAVSVTSGGTLSASITPPADFPSFGASIPVWIIQ